jgi:hypothetical protein
MQYRWQVAGWTPFILSSVADETPTLLRIAGTCGEVEIRLYVNKRQLGILSNWKEVLTMSLVQIKRVAEGRFAISLFTPSLDAKAVVGYLSSIQANAEQNRRA